MHPNRRPATSRAAIRREPWRLPAAWGLGVLFAAWAILAAAALPDRLPPPDETPYVETTPSPGGIGRYYLGREIARVMGHRGARWLERPSRADEERPDAVIAAMDLSATATVADIGAGTGYFTFRLAARVPQGRVYAVDIQEEMLDIVRKRIARRAVTNVEPVPGAVDDPGLPAGGVDAVLLVDTYHEFAYPREMMAGIVEALRPGGRVYLVEYRGEDPRSTIKPLHRMTEAQAIREMEAAGLAWVETRDFLPTQHFMVFEKPGG